MDKRTGSLIAVEGIDQSGKRTQARMLTRKLESARFPVSMFDFPDYGTPLGRQIEAYLGGRSRPDFRLVHLLYAANRWEKVTQIRDQMRRGRVVVVDRYTPSNLAYGMAHGLPLKWLAALEEGLPEPDLVVILDVSPQVSFVRKKRSRDVHEEDASYLRKVRREYLRLAKRYGWNVIDAERKPQAVHSDVWRQVSRLL